MVSMAITATTFEIEVSGSSNNNKNNVPRKLSPVSVTSSFNNQRKSLNNKGSNCQKIREALSGDFPEIETVFSDAYLESAASVPNRTLDHAISKIKRALECRRSYKVDALMDAFETAPSNVGRIFVPKSNNNNNLTSKLASQKQLVEVCASGAFCVLDEELVDDRHQRRLVVYADTSKLNWWETGVEAGLQYHVLVLEDAFLRITRENQQRLCNHENNHDNNTTSNIIEESLILCVDTTAPPVLPPPLGALRGMVRLLQKAFPDRIHKVYVGPINPLVRGLYATGVRPFLKPKLQQKIVLLGENPLKALNTTTRNSGCNDR